MQLLRKPLTQEIAQHLQEALGSFHSSPIPLPSQIRHKFGHQVCVRRRKNVNFKLKPNFRFCALHGDFFIN